MASLWRLWTRRDGNERATVPLHPADSVAVLSTVSVGRGGVVVLSSGCRWASFYVTPGFLSLADGPSHSCAPRFSSPGGYCTGDRQADAFPSHLHHDQWRHVPAGRRSLQQRRFAPLHKFSPPPAALPSLTTGSPLAAASPLTAPLLPTDAAPPSPPASAAAAPAVVPSPSTPCRWTWLSALPSSLSLSLLASSSLSSRSLSAIARRARA